MLKLFLLMCSIAASIPAVSNEMFWGDADIDWWNDGKTIPRISIDKLNKPKDMSKEELKIYWAKAHDPRFAEFWDEKAPVRVAVADPSDENVKNYMEWEKIRSSYFAKFHTKLQSFAAIEEFKRTEKEHKGFLDIPWNQVRIIYFYSSMCHACKQNIDEIRTLEKFGSNITYVQIGGGEPLHQGSIPWDSNMKDKFKITGTPTAFLRFRNKFSVLEGQKTFSEYAKIIRSIKDER